MVKSRKSDTVENILNNILTLQVDLTLHILLYRYNKAIQHIVANPVFH